MMAVAATPKGVTHPDTYATPTFATDSQTATIASVAHTGVSGKYILIHWISWSYSIVPTAAETLTITDSTAGTRFTHHIPVCANNPGSGFINFGDHPYVGSVGESVTVALSAGQATNVGTVNVCSY